MNTTTNQSPAITSTPKRIILASAYRHERHSADRQERATITLHKMGHDDHESRNGRRLRSFTFADETLDD